MLASFVEDWHEESWILEPLSAMVQGAACVAAHSHRCTAFFLNSDKPCSQLSDVIPWGVYMDTTPSLDTSCVVGGAAHRGSSRPGAEATGEALPSKEGSLAWRCAQALRRRMHASGVSGPSIDHSRRGGHAAMHHGACRRSDAQARPGPCPRLCLSSPATGLLRHHPTPHLYVPGLVVEEEHVSVCNPRGCLDPLEVCDLGPDVDLLD